MLGRGLVCRSFHLLITGLCNNYLEGGMCRKWVKYAPKLSHTPPPLIKQKLISIPPHIMMILRLTPPPLPPWKRSLPIDSLIPSLLVGFLPPIQTSLQMTLGHTSKSHLNSHQNHWTLLDCVVFAWIARFLVFYNISGTEDSRVRGWELDQSTQLCFHLS